MKKNRTSKSKNSTNFNNILEAFRNTVDTYGQNIAVRAGKITLTYKDLDQQSSAMAMLLKKRGIKKGGFVGVTSEPRIEMAVALVAILKAGAAYVPLEESYPKSRLKFIAKDTGLNLVLGQSLAMQEMGMEILSFEDFPKGIARPPKISSDEESIAYIMYTSGSTGDPKGVTIPHRAILRLAKNPNFIDLNSSHKILQNSPVAFDASTLEIWGALLNGCELVIPENTDQSLRALGDAIRDSGITTLWLTAGLFHAMVDERPEDLAPIQQLLTGGDVVSPTHAAKLLKLYPSIQLTNGYGPTENTTFTCCHPITENDLEPGKSIPIGKPIRGTDVFILNQNLEKVTSGEEGELCAGGKGLALGYWQNPELTAQKFVAAPWDSSLTLYRTGDKVRMRADGSIEFIGRVDTQVKIRGFRVELGEIENALGTFPEIQQCAVIADSKIDQANKVLKAYFSSDSSKIENNQLREYLSTLLPSYAIPNLYYQLEKLPLTPNGKIDRKELQNTTQGKVSRKEPKNTRKKRTTEDIAPILAQLFEEILVTENIDRSSNFFDLGATSLHIARVHEKLQSNLGKIFPITYFFEYTTIDELAQHFEVPASTKGEPVTKPKKASKTGDDHIAIIGMAGKFPGAPDVKTFWQNLLEGKETISHFSANELDFENGKSPNVDESDLFVKARGIVEGSDLFDAHHFGIPPKEAEQMDPQHRILLECAQTALEDAGYDPDRFDGKIGIYSGSSQNSYLLYNLCSDRSFAQQLAAGYPVNNFPVMFGNDKDFLPSRIAYKLNLKGPAVAVQCACSTSLVAVAQAAESLVSGQSDMVLAGGVSLTFPQKRDYLYTPDGMASSDGHCRTFDDKATGTVFGEGAGLVVLRRLSDAIESGDNIIAVIRGFAINNDGSAKAGYAAPSIKGQVDVIVDAQKAARVSARSIGYVEAHGTGTPLGDPIEVAALNEAFSRSTTDEQFCALGTAKTNVGHLDIAAGVTGLIKAALTVQNGEIPPLLHYSSPNKNINFEKSAFFPVSKRQPWHTLDQPRRAGVSAFGVGGTNIHMILEQSPELRTKNDQPKSNKIKVFPVSASSSDAVKDAIKDLGVFAKENSDISIEDIAETLKYQRRQYSQRSVISAASAEDFTRQCLQFQGKIASAKKYSKIAFLFPGQGSQHIDMGKDLFQSEKVFCEALTECAALLEPHLNENLLDIIYPDDSTRAAMVDKLKNTRYAQPAIFSIGYALAKQWASWGIEPECLAGHSIGEFAAACLAGVFSLEDGLKLIALRGKLMADLPEGAMISVRASEEELQPFLSKGLDLAAINGSKACVLSGPFGAAEQVEIELEEAGFPIKRLHTSHAFHSSMMDPIVDIFAQEVSKVALNAPEIPILSTVSAEWLSDRQACDPNYWASHLRQTVRFYDTIRNFWEAPEHILVEAGPGQTLTALASQNPNRRTAQPVIASLPSPTDETSSNLFIHSAFGNLWCHGFNVDWSRISPKRKRTPVKLPSYPFQRKRFWVEPKIVDEFSSATTSTKELSQITSLVVDSTQKTDVEAALKDLLSELSGLETADLDSSASFLELGFDSLLLTQVGKEIRDTFGVTVTLRELIDGFQSLNDLIAHLEANASSEKTAPLSGKDTDILAKPVVEGVKLSNTSLPASSLSAPVESTDLTASQEAHIKNLVDRYVDKTPESKRLTAEHRPYYADPRTASGFNRLWKEMVYQIVTVKSKGSRLLDIDGNEYIDILNGFGPGFLGHSPDIIVNAVTEQLEKGYEVGPQSLVAMEAAQLFCEVTGNDRTSFVSTGSEAVQAAMRIARTITGRDKIVMFARDYHGNFDEVLVRGVNTNGTLKSIPMAPGIPKKAAADMIVLPYGMPQSLEIIQEIADDLAAVIVEPVQSRRPDFQPRQFIRDIRRVTEKSGSLFIFDEVVTGFRFGLRGAQDFYGVDADLITYGKVIGGGMPIGVVSGKAKYMDTFDGGQWQYGDASFPDKPVTFFAGTFVRHPLAMASVNAMLNFLKEQPPFFWKVLGAKGDRLATTVDNYFKEHDLPFSMTNCGSLMYVKIEDGNAYGSLLFAHMREKGVFLLEEFPSYLTAAHTENDVDYVIAAFKESADELMAAGFFGKQTTNLTTDQQLLEGPTPKLNGQSRKTDFNNLTTIEIPTTESQKEIWLATLINPEASTAYNESVRLHLTGSLNITALTNAVKQTFNRHDALRSRFSADGMTMLIGPELGFKVPVVDLTGFGSAEAQKKIDRILLDEVEKPFDQIDGPYIRAQILALSGTEHILVITAHHIVCDGWSIDVVMRDIGDLYTAISNNRSAVLAPSESIVDYARIERQWQTSENFKEAADYWQNQFNDFIPTLNFPTDRPHPSIKTTNGARVDGTIRQNIVKALRGASAKSGGTFVNILFSAFNLYLYRLTGQHDLVVGMTSAGQSAREMEGVVGHCVNLLPIRSYIDDDMQFSAYMKSVRGKMLDAFDQQHYTYGTLIKNLKTLRDPSRVMLTPILFNFDNGIDLGSMKFDGLSTEFASNPRTHEHFEIFLSIMEDEEHVTMEWSYNTDLFDDSTIKQHMNNFEKILEEVSQDPDLPIKEFAFAGEQNETNTLEFGKTDATVFPGHLGLHQIIEQRADKISDTTAITFYDRIAGEESVLNYGALNERANQLAHHLKNIGILKGDLVAFCLDRSPDTLVSMLGILKAGAAYVPIDPEFPADRIDYMIGDSQAKALVTQESLKPNFSGQELTTIAMDSDKEDLSQASTENLEISLDEGALAYVIYTSGSTGKPKGVQISHRSVVNFLHSMVTQPGFSSEDTLLALTTVSFDIAVLELFLPLYAGGSLVLAGKDDTYDGNRLIDLIETYEISVMQATPATWRLLLDAEWQGSQNLKILCGGEALSHELAGRLAPICKSLWNMYGPTETTIWSTVAEIDDENTSVSIGQPIENTDVFILDTNRNSVAVGVPGELFIGGEGLALGYLGKPELTKQKFVPHPFSKNKKARLYSTGDLARWTATGTIECLGRIDRQVKIRGYRIELGEIEAALESFDEIQQAAVIRQEDGPGNEHLVAHIVAVTKTTNLDTTVRKKLAKYLPDYMVPSIIQIIDELPLTPNRKVDYRALPIVEFEANKVDETAANTRIQRDLVDIWQNILKVESVGINANFFELGGHSLLAVRMGKKIQQVYSLNLAVSTIFSNPTVKMLAEVIAKAESDAPKPLQKSNYSGSADRTKTLIQIPTTESQKEIWMATKIDPESSTAYNQSVSLKLNGGLNLKALIKAVKSTFDRHDALRSRFTADGLEMIIVQDQVFHIPIVDLSGQSVEERRANLSDIFRSEVDTPFDHKFGPYLRAQVICLAENEHLLVLTAHHIVCDGWSIDVIMRDIGTFYSAIDRGVQAVLPRTESIVDYAFAEQEWEATAEYQAAEKFWLGQFKDKIPTLNFPTDRLYPALKTSNGARIDSPIDSDLVKSLQATAAKFNCTFVNILFAVFNLYVFRQTQQKDLVIGMPSAGQPGRDMEGVVGHCVNLLPIRSYIDDTMAFSAYMKALQTDMLQAFDHQLYTYGTLIKNLKVTRDPSRVMLSPIVFSLDYDVDLSSLEERGLEAELQLNSRSHEHFEIFLHILEAREGVSMEWSYNTDLFDAETIRRHMTQFVDLLSKIAENPEIIVAEIEDTFDENNTKNDPIAENYTSIESKGQPDHLISSAPIEKELEVIWRDILTLENIKKNDDFFELGGHSLLALRLFAQIYKKYEIDLPISTLFLNPTIEKLAVKIFQSLPEEAIATAVDQTQELLPARRQDNDEWCTTTVIREGGSKPPLFIVGGLGGNVNNLRELALHLSDEYPVIGIQTRGILGHTPHETIGDMAAEHIRDIRLHQKTGPYHIAGYSGGGLTAFEIVRQLEQLNEEVAFLGIIDTFSPGFSPSFEYGMSENVKYEVKRLRNEGFAGLLARAKGKIRNSRLAKQYVKVSSRVLSHHHRIRLMELKWLDAAEKYKGGTISSNIVLFQSAPITLADEKIAEIDDSFGWNDFTDKEVQKVRLNGNHFTILEKENAVLLASVIDQKISG